MRALKYCLLCVAGMFAAGVAAQSQHFHANIQNENVSRYMNEVTYTSKDDTSRVNDYLDSLAIRLDVPSPAYVQVPDLFKKSIGSKTFSVHYWLDGYVSGAATDTVFASGDSQGAPVYDVQPGTECFFKTYVYNLQIGSGKVTTEGPVRMINLSSMRNVRDIGGWTTVDGRTVKYGKLIRGSELNGMHEADAADKRHLMILGVSAEIDLRADYEEGHGVSAFGFKSAKETESGEVASYLYTSDSGQTLSQMTKYAYLLRWRQEFNFIVSNLRAGRTIYYHCRWGADRTGFLSLLLEGLLGVTYDGMVKDYELTSFATMNRTKETIDPVIEFIEALDGETLQEKFRTFWTKRVGVNQTDIDYFINEMLEGDESGVEVGTSFVKIQESSIGATDYDLTGRRVSSHQRGLVIRRQQDGSVRKMVKTY